MRENNGYKIAVVVLACIVVLQWLFLAQPRRQKTFKPKQVPPAAALKGKIAIVLDDWGYNRNNLALVRAIHAPMTISILPHLPYTGVIAADAQAQGLEVIVHLPLEPHEKFRLEQQTILTSMDAQAIRATLHKALEDIHYAKGVSNHMGSKATENALVMGIIFEELKKSRLYFLDSFVSSKSVCAKVARAMNIPFVRRDVFLDNTGDPAYIKGQISKLAKKASLYKTAVGIGHDRTVTLEVLREVIPELQKEGYAFVFLSELAR